MKQAERKKQKGAKLKLLNYARTMKQKSQLKPVKTMDIKQYALYDAESLCCAVFAGQLPQETVTITLQQICAGLTVPDILLINKET